MVNPSNTINHQPDTSRTHRDLEQRVDLALDHVFDPELPTITIRELGILRSIEIDDRDITVWITPTWSGCPALDEITKNIYAALAGFGRRVTVKQKLSPAWSSRWLSRGARRKLLEMNITPPIDDPSGKTVVMHRHRLIECPRCHKRNAQLISECGSTACKSLFKCTECANVFEYFKDIG